MYGDRPNAGACQGEDDMQLRNSLALAAALGGVMGLGVAAQVRAGGDKVAFPKDYDKGTLYATVDRYDVKQYRELWATPSAVEAVRKGEPIPSGTVLTLVQYKAQVDAQNNPVKDAGGRFVKGDLIAYTVMEKRTGWGTEYADDIRNGEWEYQAFNVNHGVNDKANLQGCFGCHKPHAAQDFVISLASLRGTEGGESAVPRPGPGVVSISNFLFGPEQVTVAAGAPITFVNTDASPHQVTLRGPKAQRTALILKGQSAQVTIAEPGVHDYICGLHPNMKGKIEVK
jgi:plastocyanin